MLQTPTAAVEPAALLDVHQAAQRLGFSESWVRRHEKQLPAVRFGRSLRFDSDLLDLKASGKIFSEKSLVGNESPVIHARRYQSGAVYLTGKIKTWYGMYREDTLDGNGKLVRKQRNIRLGTQDELPTKTAARMELQKRMQQTSKPTTQKTLAEVVTEWQVNKLPTLKLSTQGVYKSGLKVVLETLGKMPIRQLDRYAIEKFLAVMSKRYSRNSLHQFLRSLSVVCSWAVPKYLESNPCQKIGLPKGNGNEIARNGNLKPEQVRLLSESLPEPYSTLILFLYCTGLRVGEGIAVKWSDFDGHTLMIQRRVYDGVIDSVKTKAGNRSLPIPESLMSRLKSLGQKSQWVFPSRAGTPINPGNLLKRYVKPAAKKLEIPLVGFHDLRHSATRQLGIGQGTNPKVIQRILGHATLTETLATYTHAETADYAEPLNRLAERVISQPVVM